MSNWFVRINLRKENKGEFFSEQVERKIYYDIETKKEVLKRILEDYPEYFDEKVPQRTSQNEFFFVNIYELDEYWEKFWNEPVFCKYCGENPIKKIDKKNYGDDGYYFCCKEHKETYRNNRLEQDVRVYKSNHTVGFVYKITEKATGKVYIGKTVNHPVFRWFQHFKAETGSRFHQIMKTSDITDWSFEVVDKLKNGTDYDLSVLESEWIAKYDSTNPEKGFNTKN